MYHYPFHLTWKFPLCKGCSLAHFEYEESFGQSWVKFTEWSIWLENFHCIYKMFVSNLGLVLVPFEYKESFEQIWNRGT